MFIENHKSTYVSLLGIEKARAYEEQLFQSCLEKVYGLTFNHGLMIEMINKVMKRVN